MRSHLVFRALETFEYRDGLMLRDVACTEGVGVVRLIGTSSKTIDELSFVLIQPRLIAATISLCDDKLFLTSALFDNQHGQLVMSLTFNGSMNTTWSCAKGILTENSFTVDRLAAGV